MAKQKATFLKDTEYHGKDSAYLDVDRYINEGLAGGTVFEAADTLNIEQALDFHDETKPNENK